MSSQGSLEGLEDSLEWETWKGDFPFWKHAVGGSCAGVMEHIVLFPLDTIKTRIQVMKISILNNSSDSGGTSVKFSNSTNTFTQPTTSTLSHSFPNLSKRLGNYGFQKGELISAIQNLVQEGGLPRFFRGVTTIAVGCVPAHASFFSVYEITKYKLGVGTGGNFSPIQSAICGAAATVSHDLILTPTDLVKQRLQLGCYNGPFDCIRTVLKNEGIHAFFRSMPTTLLMNIPFGAVAVTTNELMKHLLGISSYSSQGYHDTHTKNLKSKLNGEEVHSQTVESKPMSSGRLLLLYFICAGIGGGLAGFVTNPLDVIKTRLQTQDIEVQREMAQKTLGKNTRISPTASMKYQSLTSTIKTMFAEEKLFGFWRGTYARMAQSIPATALSWGTYESVKFLLNIVA